jgi:hypothetical protein
LTASQNAYLNLADNTFYKVKDLSYYDHDFITSPFPVGHLPFDSDDSPPSNYFNRGTNDTSFNGVGIVFSNGPQRAGAISGSYSGVSPRGWTRDDYSPQSEQVGTDYIDYVKAKRTYTQVPSLNDSSFTQMSHGTAFINGDLTISTADAVNLTNKNVVIVVNGTLNISADIVPSNAATALIAKNIFINESVAQVQGLLVADTIRLISSGSSGQSTTPLKIVGTLTSGTPVDTTLRNRIDKFRPSLFITADPDAYTALLSEISTVRYDWKQLQ